MYTCTHSQLESGYWRIVLVNRLTKIEYGCLLALVASTRSEDPNTKVGCAIENAQGKIISTGYNGIKSGFNLHDIDIKSREDKLKYFIHAEVNALSQIRKGEGKVIYLTHSPCESCAHNIIAHEIENVYYLNEYHKCKNFKKIFDTFTINYRIVTDVECNNIKNQLTILNLHDNT